MSIIPDVSNVQSKFRLKKEIDKVIENELFDDFSDENDMLNEVISLCKNLKTSLKN